MRRPTTRDAQHETPELDHLRVQCAHVAWGLFNDAEAVDREIEAIFQEIPAPLRHPSNRAALEAWLLGEVVRGARRHAREVAEKEERRRRAEESSDLLWRKLHRRGELAPLLEQLPAVYAEVFTLRYIDRAPLSEMMRRTGASAGVVTHRIAQASERLYALTSAAGLSRECHATSAA